MKDCKFKLGDSVLVGEEVSGLTHSVKKSYPAVIVGFYPHFLNVMYKEGYQQSVYYDMLQHLHYVRHASEENDSTLRKIYEKVVLGKEV